MHNAYKLMCFDKKKSMEIGMFNLLVQWSLKFTLVNGQGYMNSSVFTYCKKSS